MELLDKRYNDVRLIFEEGNHTYTDTLGNSYISTTTILHNYAPKFDKKYWLSKKAKELGISEKTLEQRWDNITKEACDRGSKTHNEIEDSIRDISDFKKAVRYQTGINGEMITVADIPNINMNIKPLDVKLFKEATQGKYPDIYRVFDYYVDNGYTIYSELGGFLLDYLVSGMIDILCIREDNFVIGDWKTNRGGLKFESGYYKKDKSVKPHQLTNMWVPKDERLLPPLNHMYNCNGSIYNLQLSMYAYMVHKILNIPCASLWLCHIDSDFILNDYGMPLMFPDGMYHVKKNPVPKTTIYKLNFRYQEIQAILNDRRKVLESNITTVKDLFE